MCVYYWPRGWQHCDPIDLTDNFRHLSTLRLLNSHKRASIRREPSQLSVAAEKFHKFQHTRRDGTAVPSSKRHRSRTVLLLYPLAKKYFASERNHVETRHTAGTSENPTYNPPRAGYRNSQENVRNRQNLPTEN